jgi:class 3 adenylate cyclase
VDADRRRRPGRLFAAARNLNQNPALVARVRGLRASALGGDEHVDRLSTARGRPADVAARQLLELRGDTPGLLGEVGLTAVQAWQRLSEAQNRGRGAVDVAILFTDLVDFSSWMLEAGDRPALRLLRELSEVIEPPIAERRGEVVKRLGDGLMGAFWDAPSAVEAAFEVHARASEIGVDGYMPVLRTGIHLGRPRKIGGDYLGVDVNIAARIAEAARADEILVSGRTLAALGDGPAMVAERRPFSAKGVPAGLDVHAIRPASAPAPAPGG